ncbi:hypothetical protein BO82DRAFT_127383 [Aspergillus uvarum CBS 121591]|uniref:Uncharacterized protein n=1 Tax=Aspergillus uvarum CBS 121591 TaxID=1448315 RepID=A0A319CM71_9EURO|nr:hypothetical protein BO82DRAFT_127383 [Aspergillus uvarum CBS 121591]PYH79743.1 hypothetical protein BO82DRAFT_127383 [Aspergillus uvarum CBS 121591]
MPKLQVIVAAATAAAPCSLKMQVRDNVSQSLTFSLVISDGANCRHRWKEFNKLFCQLGSPGRSGASSAVRSINRRKDSRGGGAGLSDHSRPAAK